MTQFYKDGLEAFNNNQYDTAKQLFISAIEQEPENCDAHFYLGQVYDALAEAMGTSAQAYELVVVEFTKASESYRNALEFVKADNTEMTTTLNNHLSESLAQYGHFLYRNEKFTDAEAQYFEALKIDGHHYIAMHQIAMCKYKAGDFAESRTFFEQELEYIINTPELADAYLNIALTYMKESNWKQAENFLDDAETHAPKDPRITGAKLELANLRTDSTNTSSPAQTSSHAQNQNGLFSLSHLANKQDQYKNFEPQL